MIDDVKLKELFIEEVSFHIKQAREALNNSFENPENSNEIYKIIKVFHTIKGSAGIMGLQEFSDALHICENFFQTIKNSGYTPETKIKAIQIIDEIENLITVFPKDFEEYLKNLSSILNNESITEQNKQPKNIEETKVAKPDLQNINVDIISQLRELADEVTQIVQFSFNPKSKKEKEKYNKKISELFQYIENITLVSLENLEPKLKNIAHYAATKLNKDINIEINFNKIGIDKKLLSIVEESLIHIIRNAVSHGIEDKDTRSKKNKKFTGTILVNGTRVSNKIRITVEDDGAGIPLKEIGKKAVDLGIFTENEIKTIDSNKLINLIFTPNFSTSKNIDDISGRGIGLDIVKERIESIGGLVKVTTSESGTKFILEFPTSLNIIHCVVVSTAENKIAIPIHLIDKFISIKKDMFITDNKIEKFIINDNEFQLIKVSNIFRLDDIKENMGIIVKDKNIVVAFEKYIGEKLFSTKELNDTILSLPKIVGFSIDDDLKPIAIINPLSLEDTKFYIKQSTDTNKTKKRVALVVDDNNLIREMISEFLNGENINTITAQDGKEALKIFKNNDFDIVITDIEMPKMDGFSLLKEIRNINKIIPVLILSSKGDEKDIELALKNGANGYFVKKFFSKDSFLNKVNALI